MYMLGFGYMSVCHYVVFRVVVVVPSVSSPTLLLAALGRG